MSNALVTVFINLG